MGSSLGWSNAELAHVFPITILVGYLTLFVRLIEQHLGNTFIGVNFGGQRRGVGKLESYMAFPFGFQRRDIDNNAAPRIGGFAQANCQYITWDAEIFHSAGKCE